MIKSFRHRGLQRLYERGDRSRINATLVDKVETALGLLDRTGISILRLA
jgi:plasmid maintenance system killer protein